VLFINSHQGTALVQTSDCKHRETKVHDGIFVTMARRRDSDQDSNRAQLLSLFEEIKTKFDFKWFPELPIRTDLGITFSSVSGLYKQEKDDFLDSDYGKKFENEQEFKTLFKAVNDSVAT